VSDHRVVYVVSRWGEPTQTFVRREAEAVAAMGRTVEARSLKPLGPGTSPIPAVHLGPMSVATGAARALVRRPGPTLRVLGTVVARSRPRNIPRQLAAAASGLAWAGRRSITAADHLHAHFGWVAATAAWAAATVSGATFSVVLHAFELHKPALVDRFTPVPLRAATQVFTISRADADLVRARHGTHAAVLRMGVTAAWMEPVAGERDPWAVVSIGSLVPKKGHDHLLAALAAADPRWHAVIVGDGPLCASLTTRRDALGLADRVTFAGLLDETGVRRLLDTAAVCCLACVEAPDGDRDGIPVALMEAMARGATVVTTRVGAIDELVEGAGLLVDPGDDAALADAVDRLRDEGLREKYAAAGRARVADEFTVDQAAAQVAAVAGGEA
jgi:glycosyltransferase involved in cell wall biosynthesis